jgi:hypothetical protein
MDRDVVRGFDAQAHLVATDIDNGDYDVVTDHDAFVTVPRKYQHRKTLSVGISRLIRAKASCKCDLCPCFSVNTKKIGCNLETRRMIRANRKVFPASYVD